MWIAVGSALAGVTLEIEPVEPVYDLGEPLWIDLVLHDDSPAPFDLAIADDHQMRWNGVRVEVIGADGARGGDVRHAPRTANLAGNFPMIGVAPGGSTRHRIDLARYTWVVPGVHEVRLAVAVGGDTSPWASTRIEVRPVDADAAARIVASLPRTWAEQPHPRLFYESLGHAVYVPILEPLAARSRSTPGGDRWSGPSGTDDRALEGLSACPCTEATEALLRLYDRFEDPALRDLVADELLARGPRPPPHVEVSPWFTERAWDPGLADELLDRGRAALGRPAEGESWPAEYEFGADVVRQVGGPADAPALVAALDRALAAPLTPSTRNRAYPVVARLAWVLRRFPGAADAVPCSDDARRVLDLLPWDGRSGDEPAGWEARVLRALASRNPMVATLALDVAPRAPSPALVSALCDHLGSSDRILQQHAARNLGRYLADPAARDVAIARLRAADGPAAAELLDALRPHVRADEWLALAVEHEPHAAIVERLWGLLDGCGGWTLPAVPEAEVQLVRDAWARVLAGGSAALPGGRVPIVPGATDPALVWTGWGCTLADGRRWP